MNRDAGDLREMFVYAFFQRAGNVVDLGDGQGAIHGAVAGHQDFLLDLAHKAVSQRFLALRRRILLCIIAPKVTHLGRCSMSRSALTRTNLLLETGKVRRLRAALQSRSNSEAVRLVIDERLTVEAGLQALRRLRKRGGLVDLFGRAPAKRQ